MIRAHVAAVKALMTFGVVYDGVVPDRTTGAYRVLYADSGSIASDDLAHSSTWRQWRFMTTSVGTTPEQARAFAEHAQSELVGVRPTVSGRSCGPIYHDGSRPVDRDDDVSPPLFYAVDSWFFMSTPA
jgi:hypothetical protein